MYHPLRRISEARSPGRPETKRPATCYELRKRGKRRIAYRTEALKRQILDLNAQIVVTNDPARLRTFLQRYVQAALALEQELSEQAESNPVQTHPTPPRAAQDIIDSAIGDTQG